MSSFDLTIEFIVVTKSELIIIVSVKKNKRILNFVDYIIVYSNQEYFEIF